MTRVLVRSFGVSLDGFAAGPDQGLEHPLGVRGPELMDWFFPTRVWQQMQSTGEANGETGIDNEMAEQGFAQMGAWILGRNMFGPVRGPWPDESWKGWWGDEPPYHVPVFVLTHHARAPLTMQGGTTFYFVTGGIHDALAQAKGRRGRARRAHWRRCSDRARIPEGRADRRTAPRSAAGAARKRRGAVRGAGPAGAGLQLRAAGSGRTRYAHVPAPQRGLMRGEAAPMSFA
jgi:dihydrofolate reductase